MEEKRKVVKRKNAMRIVSGSIAVALLICMLYILINDYPSIAILEFCIGGIIVAIFLTRLAEKRQDDIQIMEEAENLEKAKQILTDSSYTPIKCIINSDNIRDGEYRIDALKSIASTQAEALKKFNLALAAKLNEDKILYAIVDENGNEVSKVAMYDTTSFFMNNFEKI